MDENNFGIQIQTSFESASQITTKLKTLLTQVRKQTESEKINLDIGLGNKEVMDSLKGLESTIAKITANSKSMMSGINLSDLNKARAEMLSFEGMKPISRTTTVDSTTREQLVEIKQYANLMGDKISLEDKYGQSVIKTTENLKKQQQVEEASSKLEAKMNSLNNNKVLSPNLLAQGNKVVSGINPSNIGSSTAMVNSLKQQETMVLKLQSTINKYSASYDALKGKYGNLVPKKEGLEFVEIINKMKSARDKLTNEMGTSVNNNTFKQMTTDATKLQGVMSNIAKGSGLKVATQDAIGLGSALQGAFQKMMLFSGVGGIMYGITNQFKSAIGYVNEMSSAMTNIQMITGRSKSETVGLMDGFKGLAKEMSSTNAQMAKGSEEFLRAGYSDIETKEMLRQNIIASSISGQGQAETSEQLIAIKNAYDIEAKSIEHVNDVLSTLDDKSATSYKELAKIMQLSSFSAKAVKVDFEDLGAMASVISSKTR